MRLVSWNVNGVRACLKSGFEEAFDAFGADIVCLQETKARPEQVDFAPEGCHAYWNAAQKKGYSGTAVFTRTKPLEESFGMGIEEHDKEGRVITLEFERFRLVNVYTPNSQDELRRLAYRMEWEDAFRAYVSGLAQDKPVVICGDMNVAHREIDLARPGPNRRHAGFTDEEREKFSALLDAGFVDTFRHFYPEKTRAYSWWSYRANARSRNVGWRIDYFLASADFVPMLADASILCDVHGSDHCPVMLDIRL
ncbi:MAG: exodeoxyribonuclease III [Oscillospiraceae bacterium]|nr:exodeoxyribonuclease III [Oscillospiraceae bacterium]